MRKTVLLFGLFLFLGFFSTKAQYTTHTLINVGYHYQNQSFAEIGGKLLFLKKDELIFRVGGAALLGSTNGKLAIIPKIQGDVLFNFRENVDISQGFYYLIGAETTTKNFGPYIGINALGVIDLVGGYTFSYPNQTLNGKELKGLNLGLKINIPLSVFAK